MVSAAIKVVDECCSFLDIVPIKLVTKYVCARVNLEAKIKVKHSRAEESRKNRKHSLDGNSTLKDVSSNICGLEESVFVARLPKPCAPTTS